MKKQQEWIKTISDVRVISVDQEPYISLKINGKWAQIHKTQKFTAIKNGWVSIIGDFDKLAPKDRSYFTRVMPEIELVLKDEETGEEKIITSSVFTNDSRLVQLWIDSFARKLNREVREGLIKLGYKCNSC